ncbi:MAG: hypothetical protein HY475_02500, partial [Candidatus Terrybacteria bacterium]|nr:hypothetical protein [Candidatus Terrybacteria bacterium]
WTVAFMLELLDPEPGHKILDIGAGSGWQTALLAHIVDAPLHAVPRNPDPGPTIPRDRASRRAEAPSGREEKRGKVYAMERVPELCDFGKANVAKYDFIARDIVTWICGDASEGLSLHAPYDRIVAAAALRDIPSAWREQCAVGGIIVAPISGSIWRLRRIAEGRWGEEEYPGFSFVPFIRNPQKAGRHSRESH